MKREWQGKVAIRKKIVQNDGEGSKLEEKQKQKDDVQWHFARSI